MRRFSFAAVVLGALIAAAPAYVAEKKPLELTSIAPAMAQRGELVTVKGHGFGGPNVKVTVGGEAVTVVEATGTQASFRVPSLGPVGQVTVRVTNPGGHTGEIGLTVLFDGTVAVRADEANAVASEIGPVGGTLTAAGMVV